MLRLVREQDDERKIWLVARERLLELEGVLAEGERREEALARRVEELERELARRWPDRLRARVRRELRIRPGEGRAGRTG